MNTLATNPTLALYALASTVIGLHLITLALYTGTVRAFAKTIVNTEDMLTVKGATLAEVEAPSVARAQRAHRNAIENAVPFVVIGLLYALSGASPHAAAAYFGVFVCARILHSIVYLTGKQPWRTMMFGVGVLAMIGMGVHVLRVALG